MSEINSSRTLSLSGNGASEEKRHPSPCQIPFCFKLASQQNEGAVLAGLQHPSSTKALRLCSSPKQPILEPSTFS